MTELPPGSLLTAKEAAMLKVLLMTAATVVAATPAFAQNLVVNGSFEDGLGTTPTQTTGSVTTYLLGPVSPGNAVPSSFGWQVTAGNVDVYDDTLSNDLGSAQDGHRFLDLNGKAAGKISQTLTGLDTNQTYRLSFWYAANGYEGGSGVAADRSGKRGMLFEIETVPTLFNLTDISQPDPWTWTQQTVDFKPTQSNVLLSFTSLAFGKSGGITLDNISVTAVPEPSTYALMLAGLGVVAWTARRRKAQTDQGAAFG